MAWNHQPDLNHIFRFMHEHCYSEVFYWLYFGCLYPWCVGWSLLVDSSESWQFTLRDVENLSSIAGETIYCLLVQRHFKYFSKFLMFQRVMRWVSCQKPNFAWFFDIKRFKCMANPPKKPRHFSALNLLADLCILLGLMDPWVRKKNVERFCCKKFLRWKIWRHDLLQNMKSDIMLKSGNLMDISWCWDAPNIYFTHYKKNSICYVIFTFFLKDTCV